MLLVADLLIVVAYLFVGWLGSCCCFDLVFDYFVLVTWLVVIVLFACLLGIVDFGFYFACQDVCLTVLVLGCLLVLIKLFG